MTDETMTDGIEGPPCADCIHAVVCGLRTAYQTYMRTRLPIGGDLPAGLNWRIAVDCDHFLSLAAMEAVEALGALESGAVKLVHVNDGSAEAQAMAWSDGYEHGFNDAKAAVPTGLDDAAVSNDPAAALNNDPVAGEPDHASSMQEAAPEPTSVDATPDPVQLHEGPADVTPVAAPAPAEEALDPSPPPAEPAHKMSADSPARAPLGAPTVVCDPGCGATILQAVIGEHRRTCPEVLAFKAARGVTQIPDRYQEPAAPPPADDFAARRDQAAHDAAARTWSRSHPDDETPAAAPAVAAPPANALTHHERKVLASVMRHDGDRKAAAGELNISPENLGVTLDRVARKGQLPLELIERLPARFAKYARVRA